MLEPIVQDYIGACTKLSREAFCKQVGVPVLVSRTTRDEQTFQLASTEMQYSKAGTKPARGKKLDHQLPVLELRKDSSGPGDQISVGRAEENDIVIHDETVSANHAVFMTEAHTGRLLLQDFESTNGTTINGKLLVPGRALELRDGDELSFGDTVFVFYTPAGLFDELKRMLAPVESVPKPRPKGD